jgi:hypothetical protein
MKDNKKNLNCNKIMFLYSIVSYEYVYTQKVEMLKANQKKSGIYR